MGLFSLSNKKNPLPEQKKELPNAVEPAFKLSLRARLSVYARKFDGKDRDSPHAPMFSQPTTAAQILSPTPIPTPIATRQLQLKLSSSTPALRNASNSKSGNGATAKNNDSTVPNRKATSMHPSASDSDSRNPASRSRALGTKASSSSLAAPRQSDNLTATLAQRLNELAVANSEGLLDDDEYRLLRQDLFERFTSTTVVPSEVPVVPVAPHQRSVRITTATSGKRLSIDSTRISIAGSNNFIIDKPVSPSISSRSSISGVASLFRRATGRQSMSRDDASSIFSANSGVQSESAAARIKRLSRKNSNSSLTTDRGDTMSISSRRTNNTLASPIEPATNGAASVRSIRRLPMPPSSFPNRLPGVESRYAGLSASEPSSPATEDPESVQALRKEIAAVEGEARRLLDAFSGLELSTLTKHRRTTAAMGPRDSVATLVPGLAVTDARSVASGRRSRKNSDAGGTDADAASMRSATSAGTSTSRKRTLPLPTGVRPLPKPGTYSARSDSGYVSSTSLRVGGGSMLDRKNSVSSMGSSRLGIGTRSASEGGNLAVPPVPPIPLGMSLSSSGHSTHSLSRSSGHLPMGVLHEDEAIVTVDLDQEREFGQEMEDLRRRREEVAARYENRLEYLRAKLRGAELHEKLLSR